MTGDGRSVMNGSELRAWRKRLGWTQAVASRELGMTPPHYRRLESGRVEIRRTVALATERLESLVNEGAQDRKDQENFG